MEKKFDLKVYYKYQVQQGFFEEVFTAINYDTLKKIKNRFEENFKNGDYVALRIEYTERGERNE